MQAEVGVAIVPRITVAQELRDRVLVHIPVAELNMPRRTLMICREQGYLSDSARELIKVVRSFNGEMWRRTQRVPRTQSGKSIATA